MEQEPSDNVVSNYGWSDAAPKSCGYLSPPVLSILKALKVVKVLDLGSGNGAFCALLRASGFEVVGVDNDLCGVKISRSMFPEIPFHHFGIQDDPQRLIATEGTFEAVVSTEVVEHLFSPHLLPQYAAAVLPTGGFLIVSTPYHGYLKNLALSLFDHWDKHHTALWHGGHIKFWSRKTLSALLQENGFLVQSFQGVGRLPYLWKSMIVVAKKL